MAQGHSGVADCADYDQALTYGALDNLTQRAIQIRLFKVSAGGDVDDANVVFLFVVQDPFKTTRDVLIGYVAGAANLNQRNFRVRRDAAIEAVRQMTVSRSDHRRHHSVPTGDVSCFQ